ncbi:hypothetical protein GCM10027346_13180 [Hymenobacter seoulensis]
MKFLLTCKPWQLILFLLGGFILVPVIATVILTVGTAELLPITLPVLAVLSVVPFFCWLYTLATNLHTRLPATANLNLTRFKMALFFPVVYLLMVCSVGFWVASTTNGGAPNLALLALIVPFHLLSIGFILYSLKFTAKALKSVELQAPAHLGSYVGEFFMLWFFPIGLWVLQPRINHLFSDAEAEQQFQRLA